MIDRNADCEMTFQWLQRRFDGDADSAPIPVQQHLSSCAACQERSQVAELVLPILRQGEPQPCPISLAERIEFGVARDRRVQQWQQRFAVAAAIAASIALAVWFWPKPPIDQPAIVRQQLPIANDERLPTLDAVSDALAATGRAAADTVEPGRLLLPAEVELPTMSAAGLLPDLTALDGARSGLVQGFEPVTTSAKRALNMVLRDFTTTLDAK